LQRNAHPLWRFPRKSSEDFLQQLLVVFRRHTVANKEHSSSETKTAEINMEEQCPFKLNVVRGGNGLQGKARRQTLYTSLGSLAFRNLMISNYSTEIVRTTALWMLLRKQIVNKGGWKKNLKTGQWPKKSKEVSTRMQRRRTKHALSSKHTRKKITHPEIPETGRGIKPVQAQRSGARVDASGEVMRNNIHHSILSTTRRAC